MIRSPFTLKRRSQIIITFFYLVIFQVGLFQAQISYTFTNAGATGSAGPTQAQINSAYASTNLSGLVSSSLGIQTFTIPFTGNYRIQAIGAKGYGLNGGLGSAVAGDFSLVAGQVLKILVGQMGAPPNSPGTNQYGGGGGSFVTYTNNSPLVIAGGGGGSWATTYTGFSDATISGNANSGAGLNCNVGIGGSGGSGGGSNTSADGGGGLNSNGVGTAGGLAFINGGNGGSLYGHGGFGGGGGGSSYDNRRGGGGGGYSGGGGSHGGTTYYPEGGGGGSINFGSNPLNVSAANSGHGRVIITPLVGIGIVLVSPVTCNGMSNGILAASILGGNAPYTFTWSTGANTSTISGLAPGNYTCTATDANSVVYTSTYYLLQPPAINASLTTGSVTCNGGNNGSCTINVIGGVGPYTYTWFPNGGNTSIANNLSAGVYSCTLKDANNCYQVYSTSVNQPPPINLVAFASNSLVCQGASVSLIGFGAQTYTWSGGVVNAVPFTPVQTSTYTVTGTQPNGCTGSAYTTVSVIPSPTLSVGGTSIVCSGSLAQFTVTGANTYTWSNSLSGSVVSVFPLTNTVYTVSGTSLNGCVSSITKSVQANALPPVLAFPSGTSICSGGSLTLSGLGAISYSWSNGVTNGVAFNPSISSVYTVNGMDANGCINSATCLVQVISLPQLSITASGTACAGASLTLFVTGASTYTWMNSATTSSLLILAQNPTNYSVTGTALNGCTNTTSYSLSVLSLPVLSLSTSGNGTFCANSNVSITASGASSYSWQPGGQIGSTTINNPSVSTIYSVTGMNANACINTATIFVNVQSIPQLTVTSPVFLCIGDTANVSVSGAQSYTWQPINSSSPNFTVAPISNIIYTVTGIDALGCSATKTLQISITPLPTIAVISSHSLLCSNQSATLTASGAMNYTWSTGSLDFTAGINPSSTATYSIIGMGLNNCVNTQTFEQQVTVCSSLNYYNNEDEKNWLIYPNPCTGKFLVSGLKNTRLTLHNENGQLIKEIYLNDEDTHFLEFDDLNPGIYFIESVGIHSILREKLIIVPY